MKDNVLNQIIDDYKVLYHKEKEKRKELQQRIDKAIEYIETCNEEEKLNSMFLDESYISNYGAKELLEILEDKE